MFFVDSMYSHFELVWGFDVLQDLFVFSENILLGNFEKW